MGQGGSAITEQGITWITEDDPPLMLQSMEGEHHHLKQTVPPAPQDKEELQSKQPLTGMAKSYYGHLGGSH